MKTHVKIHYKNKNSFQNAQNSNILVSDKEMTKSINLISKTDGYSQYNCSPSKDLYLPNATDCNINTNINLNPLSSNEKNIFLNNYNNCTKPIINCNNNQNILNSEFRIPELEQIIENYKNTFMYYNIIQNLQINQAMASCFPNLQSLLFTPINQNFADIQKIINNNAGIQSGLERNF
jgi:hypothetical protein